MSNFTRTNSPTTGSYFRKVSSAAKTDFVGVRGAGTLPQVSFDPGRFGLSTLLWEDYRTGPMDRPSVYVGGNVNGNSEMDAGLSWMRVFQDGRPIYTDNPQGIDSGDPHHRFYIDTSGAETRLFSLTGDLKLTGGQSIRDQRDQGLIRPAFAFRPFWRFYKNNENIWRNPELHPDGTAAKNIYFLPGQDFELELLILGANSARLRVGDPGFPPQRTCEKNLTPDLYGTGQPQSFKRVNAIDQYRRLGCADESPCGNENKLIIRTHSRAMGARWNKFSILQGPHLTEVPAAGSNFSEVTGSDTAAAYDQIFIVSGLGPAGQEHLDIQPPPTVGRVE